MGSEADVVQTNGEVYLNESVVKAGAMDVLKHSLPSMMLSSPDLGDKSPDLRTDLTSPNTVLSSPPELELTCIDSRRKYYASGSPDGGSPRTPKEGFFDPFAPGLDDFMLAPRGSKYSQEPRSSAARSLNFGSVVKVKIAETCASDAEATLEEEKLLETLYGDLLEVIISAQVASMQCEVPQDEVLGKNAVVDGFQTPGPLLTLLTGVAETCPPAPMKLWSKSKNIDKGLCRRLDF